MDNNHAGLTGLKIAILTLGCKVNSYETEAMQSLLRHAGAQLVAFEEKADIYLVNTCSVTNMADKKSRQMLHRAKKLNPDAIIAATGCYVQTASETELRENGIDVLIGNNQKKDVVEILEQNIQGNINHILDISKETEYESLWLESELNHTRAYVKIQDGCNQFCSYCIIPYARGRIRSRASEEVIQETERLARAGFQEIVLTGIHLSSYGQPAAEGEQPLLQLIDRLNRMEGIQRIRLGSLEPRIITENFVKTLSNYEKVCPHFHLSLQSGSDTVLHRMNRKYTTAEYARSVEVIREVYDCPAITTDIIVGFPQETEDEFHETMKFAERIGFSKIHVFKYSRRKGTVADRMNGQVPEVIKTKRSEQLIRLEQQLAKAYRNKFLGSPQKVLFEEEVTISGRKFQAGYNERYVRIALDTTKNLSNQILVVCPNSDEREQETLLCHE